MPGGCLFQMHTKGAVIDNRSSLVRHSDVHLLFQHSAHGDRRIMSSRQESVHKKQSDKDAQEYGFAP